jgi:hypothetical protein
MMSIKTLFGIAFLSTALPFVSACSSQGAATGPPTGSHTQAFSQEAALRRLIADHPQPPGTTYYRTNVLVVTDNGKTDVFLNGGTVTQTADAVVVESSSDGSIHRYSRSATMDVQHNASVISVRPGHSLRYFGSDVPIKFEVQQ